MALGAPRSPRSRLFPGRPHRRVPQPSRVGAGPGPGVAAAAADEPAGAASATPAAGAGWGPTWQGSRPALRPPPVPAGAPEELVEPGRLLLRLWLAATRAGFSAHPVSALLDCPGTVAPALRVFGAEAEVPAALFRLGACPPVARAPRLPIQEMVEADAGGS